MKKPFAVIIKVILGIGTAVFYVLSLPPVRNLIWKKAVDKGEKKIVDVKAKVAKGEKKRLFR